jgi:hypothetical protein
MSSLLPKTVAPHVKLVQPEDVRSTGTLGLLVLLATAGCDNEGVTGPSTNGATQRGRVLDYRMETAIAGASVEFATDSMANGISATTDSNGSYSITLPSDGPFYVLVNGAFAGTTRVTRPSYRGDFLIEGGTCIGRYGTIADARTRRPVAGAAITLGGSTTTSGIDGWYRIDLHCGSPGFNTAFIYVAHPSFSPLQQGVGRGIHGVQRLDLELQRP